MDLGAYIQIENLSELAKANGIEVPRLRGYRLMVEEEPETQEQIQKNARDTYRVIRRLHRFKPGRHQRSSHWDDDPRQVRGQARRAYKRTVRQIQTYNKYCGRNDVLMIHARIGGPNWDYFGGPKLKLEPWFLEKADDGFDNTYCDIYARVKPIKEDVNETGTEE